LLQIRVQTQLECGADLRIARRLILWCVVHAMIGLVSFSTKQRVPVLHALVNPSWHLTPGLRTAATAGGQGRRSSVFASAFVGLPSTLRFDATSRRDKPLPSSLRFDATNRRDRWFIEKPRVVLYCSSRVAEL
jgi:hypothetical protein